MTTRLISYPFRLMPNGSVATLEDGTERYYAEELACLLSTRPGERVMEPEYGIEDPTFDMVVREEITAKVNTYGPPVTITDVTSNFPNESRMDIVVEFDPDSATWANYELIDDIDTEDEELALEDDLDGLT